MQQDCWPRSDGGKAEKRGHAREAGRKKRRPRRGVAGLARRRSFHLILIDLGGIRQGRGGLMICPCWGETSSRACAGRNPTGGSGSAGLLRLDEKRREMMQMADADRRE